MKRIFKFAIALCLSAGAVQSANAGSLADSPLSLRGAVPPNVMFALSVEFPTANTAAYQDASSYSSTNQYLGYFDDAKCYSYDSANGWFYPIAANITVTVGGVTVDTRTCTAGWSGNFLNWATMTGLDEFRFAMTGGNRYQDTAALTVLERAYQSGQGGTSNFPNKSFTDATGNTTPYPSGTALTLQNQGRGVQMVVTPAGSTGTVQCANPTLTGGSPAFTCTLTEQNTGDTSACTTWSGSGTLASPYTCTTFAGFSGSVPTTSVAVTPPAVIASGGTAATVTCSGPTMTGSTFGCTSLALGNGHTGTCTSWTGNGTVAAPYTCVAFSSFSGGETFAPSGSPTVTNFSASLPGPQVTDPSATGYATCTVSGSPATLTCPLTLSSAGATATCSTFSGTGQSGSPYSCSGSFGYSNGETAVSASNDGSTRVRVPAGSGPRYYTAYRLTYNQAPVATTIYYVSSYPGATGATLKYYTGSYNITFGAAQTFNVRVKVCDPSVGQESNCKQYGTAWKPTGVLQDNGDKMRFGVTSYFQANDVDNAVLRSKAKYIAPQKYASSGGLIANPLTEWNSTDGTLIRNPDASDAATVNSFIGAVNDTGVINYINKFGSVSHSYKTYDVLGKLYYETLKYLRHLSPTTAFYQGATPANADSFPVITQWDDPMLYSCQKNYIIAMGDTHTWCDKRLPGDTHTAANNSVCNAYTDGNGNSHPADFGSLGGDSGVNVATETNYVGGLEGLGNIATSYTGAGSSAGYGMAGLAAWAARNDIRSAPGDFVGTQSVSSFIIDVEEYRDCGYRSQYWLTAKYGDPSFYDSNGNWLTTNNPWSASTTLPAGACSSGAPPGYNAAGGAVTWPKNLLRAGDPLSMINSVKGAIATIVGQISDEAALAQSSGNLDTGTGAYIYQAIFNSGGWTGEVKALPIDQSGGVATTPDWTASSKLPAYNLRHVLTYNNSTRSGVTFDPTAFATNLSASQQAMLNANEFGTADGLGVDRMNYILGDQSKEAYLPGTTTPRTTPNNGWRTRSSVLGDVINSNPQYVGPPAAGYSDATYRSFATTNANRTPVLYVGGNDGMLHGYDASYTVNAATGMPTVTATSGTEVLGYVPSAVYSKLSQLMAPNYSHKYFVDGAPVAVDAYLGSPTAAWRTVLIGGLNAGGQGIYALDITNPVVSNASNFSASNVLWEFTDADDADLGYTFGKPIVRKLNDGNWYVIFGSGYNNTVADAHTSTTGRAYLYILQIEGPGNGNPWVLGTNYYKIQLISPSEPVSPTLPLNPPNGLGHVIGLDKNFDGKTDYVYGGDRNGNVWKFDLTSSTPSNWKVAFGTVANPLPLFSAKDTVTPTPNAQQITTGMQVIVHPNGGFMLLFGTGSWIDVTDPLGPFKTDSFYGIWDKDDGVTTVSGRSVLQAQQVLASVDASGAACAIGSGNCFNVYTSCQPNYSTTPAPSNFSNPLCPASIAFPNNTGQQLGWVFDLPGNGERTRSTTPRLNGSVVKFTSLTPSPDPCTGNTLGMEHNLSAITGGAPPAPLFVLTGQTSNFITIQSGVLSGYTGTIQVVPSGRALAGGASDTPVGFNARPPSNIVPTPPGIPSPPSGPCVGAACSGYIPGWGFLMNLQSRYILNCGGGATSAAVACTWERKLGKAGRIQWKQIVR